GIVAAPHRILSGGGEFALLSAGWPEHELRLGAQAMLELESEGRTSSYLPFPQSDIRFWRGIWGFSAALSFDGAARRLCARCALEVTLTFRHESEHYTGSNRGDGGTDYSDARLVG